MKTKREIIRNREIKTRKTKSKKEENLKKKSVKVEIEKLKNPEYLLFEKYINPNTYELRGDILSKITYDELNNVLNKISFLTKNQINNYLNSYTKLLFDKRANSLLRIAEKSDLKKLKKIITSEFYFSGSNVEIKKFLLTDNYDKLSDKEIKATIHNLLEIYDIFSNKFTDETFKKACDLIDSGIINKLENKNKQLIKNEE